MGWASSTRRGGGLKSSLPPSKVCFPWVSREGTWNGPGILLGCPGPFRVFKSLCQKKFLLIFPQVRKNSLNIKFLGGIFLGHPGPRRRDIPDKNFMQVALFCCFRHGVAGISRDLGRDVPDLKKFMQENFGLIFRSLFSFHIKADQNYLGELFCREMTIHFKIITRMTLYF